MLESHGCQAVPGSELRQVPRGCSDPGGALCSHSISGLKRKRNIWQRGHVAQFFEMQMLWRVVYKYRELEFSLLLKHLTLSPVLSLCSTWHSSVDGFLLAFPFPLVMLAQV